MRIARAVIATLVLVGGSYAAYPFVTLYQLRTAVRGGDAVALARLIDWSSVREGIKEDICDFVLDEPGDVTKKGQLPAFGASFVRGVTGNSVDREFTAERLAGIAHPSTEANDDASIGWAFFNSPARFTIDINVTGHLEPVKAEMELTGLRWRVKRIWIPATILQEGHWMA
jgi:hypothetical protein